MTDELAIERGHFSTPIDVSSAGQFRRAQELRIEARVEELAGALGTSITVVVFQGETPSLP